MTQEDIQLLFKDLCARLPYGVKCKVNFDDGTSDVMKLSQFPDGLGIWGFYEDGCYGRTDNFKPYLRPMSSMTDEESRELYAIRRSTQMTYSVEPKELDYLNAHHFDYRGLIEKGLALKAPKDMYIKYELVFLS